MAACLCLSHSLSAQGAKNVILFIGDGMGREHVKAANYYNGKAPLSFETFVDQGEVTTWAADNAVTDSAAAATAIATGVKVNNGVVSVALPGDGRELETMLELFKKRGKATGLITTTYLTHATPAAFGGHDVSRNNTAAIGNDLMAQTQPNILFGGGANGLTPATATSYGYQVATDTGTFNGLSTATLNLCALFGTGYLPYEEDYLPGAYPIPHLTDMVRKALDSLEEAPDGFFLMVEAGRIDHAAEGNLLPEAVHETLELSRAVQAALDWMVSHSDTLLIVTADHETGGLTVTKDNGLGIYPNVTWSGAGHTAANVPVYATGPGASLVPDTMDNTQFLRLVTLEGAAQPYLYRVSVQELTSTSATIVWNTDEACTSALQIRAVGGVWTDIPEPTATTTHRLPISGLTPGATYEYRVSSTSSSGSTTSAVYTFAPISGAPGALTLVDQGSVWKYHDNGVSLGTAWRAKDYVEDASWQEGPAELGYGDGGEKTILGFGPNSGNKYPTYYFRQAFSVADPAAAGELSLSLYIDDGAMVYLNGMEVHRANMAAGTVLYTNYSSTVVGEATWAAPVNIPNYLVAGNNVLAVELHQCNAGSSDASFDLKLAGTRHLSITLNSPAANATEASIPATLTATASDPEGQPLTVTFYGRQALGPVPDFSIVVLPDTQFYTDQINGGTKEMFISQTQWIVDNRDARNIVYVAHLGDISNNGDTYLDEWVNASDALYLLETPPLPLLPDGIPYGAAVGNHDQIVSTTRYNEYFGYSRFQGRSYYGGRYGASNNNNHYDLFSASGLDFIVIYLEYDTSPDQPVLDWADALLKAHPNRRGIVVSHYLLETSAAWGAQGQAIFNALSDNPNLFLMMCGHNPGEVRRTDAVGGRNVHTLMSDYQARSNGGNGWMRILEFSPAQGQMRVKTYSPWLSQSETDADSEFTLDGPVATGPTFALVQQNSLVPSGAPTTATWSGLSPGTAYEWLAVAAHGLETTTSEVRKFTTMARLNTAPVATDNSYAATEDVALTVSAPGLLANDSDADGDPISAVLAIAPTRGTLSLQADGSFIYTPAANFNGSDSFTYRASDGLGQSAPVTVTIDVSPVNDSPVAVDDAVTTTEDTALEIAVPGVLGNDVEVDGDGLMVSSYTQPVKGAVLLTAEGGFVYSPNANSNGSDTFTYTVSDGNGGIDTATVGITVVAVNDPPLANPQSVTVAEDGSLPITLAGSDVDSGTLTYTVGPAPSHGTLSGTAPNLIYTPAGNYNGPDSFTYTATDGSAQSASATVTITVNLVNDSPVVANDTFSTDEDTALTVAGTGVLGNDTDVDGTLAAILITGPTKGILALNPDGSFTYTPNLNYSGSDGFTYSASDGVASTTATVSITVKPVNDAPVANAQTVTVQEGETVAIVLTGSDVDGDSLTYTVAEGPISGALTGSGQTLSYASTLQVGGSDSFTFTVSDGKGGSATATVGITVTGVNDPPVAIDDTATTPQNMPVVIAVLSNDADADGDALTVTVVTPPTRGSVTVSAGKTVTYTPDAGAYGPDSFTYTVSDGMGGTASANVTVTVSHASSPPLTGDDSFTVFEDSALAVPAPGVLYNDTRYDSDPLAAILVDGPTHGTLTLAADGSFNYVPNANFSGNDSFTYKASDVGLESVSATVTITVSPVNDPPAAANDSFSTDEDTILTITVAGVLGNDTDADGTLTASLDNGPTRGEVTLNPNGSFTYRPAENYNGSDNFTYSASDGVNTATATVSLTVNPVNDPPVANAQDATVAEDGSLPITLAGSDVDSGTLTYTVGTAPSHGTLSGTAPDLIYTPLGNYNGPDSFTYTASDGSVQSAYATVTITVSPVNDSPVAANDSFSTDEDTTLTVTATGVLGNDTDVDGTLIASLFTEPTWGTVTLSSDGSFTYTPNSNYNGPDSFTYRASDGVASTTATVNLTVNPVNDAPAANAQTVTVAEGGSVVITLTGSDVDSSTLTYTVGTAPSHGTLSGTVPNLTYRPAGDYNGPDSFTCSASDGVAATPATVSITVSPVNDAPVANAQTVTVPVGASVEVMLTGSDVDGDSLTYTVVAAPASGALSGSGQNLTYTPTLQVSGSDSFTFAVSDGHGGTAYANVTITVTAVVNPPSAPSGLIATPLSDTKIGLTWDDNSSDEDGFLVERSLDDSTWSTLATLVANTTSLDDDGLVSGTPYYYRVSATKGSTQSPPSSKAAAAPYVEADASSETTVIATLSGTYTATWAGDQAAQTLTEKLSGSKSARTSALEHRWAFSVPSGKSQVLLLKATHAPTADGESFVFAWSTDGVNYQDALALSEAVDAAGYLYFELPGTLQGTLYIRARDTDRTIGKTALDSISVDHLAIWTDVSPVITPPAAPVLTAATAGNQSVSLTWDPSPGATSYTVWRTEGGTPTALVTSLTSTSFTDTTVNNGTTYRYTVTALNSFGESPYSNELSATPQAPLFTAPPANLTATGSRKRITLNWVQSSTPGVTQNVIYRSSSGGPFTKRATIAPAATTWSEAVLTGATYSYQVTAVSGVGESPPSNTATATGQ